MTSPSPSTHENRATAALLTAIVFVGFALRCYHLSTRGLWGDEIDLWFGALSDYRSHQMAPLPAWIHGAWLRLSRQLTSPTAFHVPALVLGALAPLSFYLLGRELYGRRAGLIAAALIALSPMALFYSQEARPYSLFVNLAALALVAAVRFRLEVSLRGALAAATLAAALMATHILAGPFLLTIAVWTLCDNLRSGLPRPLVMPAVWDAGAVVGAVWILNRHTPADVVSPAYAGGLFAFVTRALRCLGPDVAGPGLTPANVAGSLLMLGLAVLGGRRLTRSAFDLRLWLLVATIVVPSATLFLTLGARVGWRWERYLTAALPAYLVLVAGGLASLSRERRELAGLLVLASLAWGIVNWAERDTFDRSATARRVAAALEANPTAVNGLVIVTPQIPGIAAAAYDYFRTDGLPTWVLSDYSLSSVPSGPFVPTGDGNVMAKTPGLPPGLYLVTMNHTGKDAMRALAIRGVSGGRRRDDLSAEIGFDVVEFSTLTARKAVPAS